MIWAHRHGQRGAALLVEFCHYLAPGIVLGQGRNMTLRSDASHPAKPGVLRNAA